MCSRYGAGTPRKRDFAVRNGFSATTALLCTLGSAIIAPRLSHHRPPAPPRSASPAPPCVITRCCHDPLDCCHSPSAMRRGGTRSTGAGQGGRMSDRSEEDQPVPRPLSEGAPTRRSLSEGHSAARPLAEVNHEPVEPTYRRALRLIHFLIRGLIRRDWRDQAKLPQTGGVVVVVNHISNVDPIAVAQYLAFSGRWGKFLAKDSLFRVPVVGRVL